MVSKAKWELLELSLLSVSHSWRGCIVTYKHVTFLERLQGLLHLQDSKEAGVGLPGNFLFAPAWPVLLQLLSQM